MRVVMITPPLPTPARPSTTAPVARQIASLRALGVQVDVLELKGIKKLKYLPARLRLRALARPADLIHAHFGYSGWLARSQFSKPVIVSFMGEDLLGTPDADGHLGVLSKVAVQVNRYVARTMDAVIVKSAEMAEVVRPVRAHIIPNGVDLRAFRPLNPREARTVLGWTAGKRYILFPGYPAEPRKGFPLAKAAVAHASARMGEPLELVPLGDVAPDRVALFMNACDVMTLTSYHEGSPNVVKEAMACNLPIVSVPVGDVPERLAGVAGCAICPRDPAALGAALVHVLRDGRRTTGRCALQAAGLDQDTVARKILAIYDDVLACKCRSR
jgi:glycosyltransferase involved in cell wall biosynthesis